ncbi:holo-[acyl-carrier protein] synthase [Abditibacterium utsteinense]|uniref:Holo-[acyl-carrier-protein] synthase n=1 Tax=Abditibacterium utsteinense TaxID=1960156 RepID=A0A2S8SQA7_9BACT|nr:holo-ACP synthase [Abditibacterium utsteinense]PQV62980.1 holo-[acyl-carrier protein] synthase [Abditibacterium utsteinense]
MILGIGIDVSRLERVEQFIERYGDRFSRRILTEAETLDCFRVKNPAERVAGCIAAKEAASKALGTGWRRGVHWKCFEVSHEMSGKPTLLIHGRARELADEMGVKSAHLSITHDAGIAAAVVIFES